VLLQAFISQLKLEGSFRLSYNVSVFAREGLGILLTFRGLIHTEGTGMVFRPLSPLLTTDLYLIWNRYQTFTPLADKFRRQILSSFRNEGPETPGTPVG
jgi:DNA-binding transcriptional LysR family regulator